MPPAAVDAEAELVRGCGRSPNHATSVRIAVDDAERALLWKGRKAAFGAVAQSAPDYYLHDTVVPRTKLVEVDGEGLRDRRSLRPDDDECVPCR